MARILIVDDSIVMRKNLATILTGGGHIIVGEASNGRQAFTSYNELLPDIVTMDITMPVMDGVEAVTWIKQEHPDAKIIMISAVNQKKMVFDAINKGAQHYIVKPIEPKKLLCIIDEVMGTSHEEIPKEMTTFSPYQQGFQIDNVSGAFTIQFNESLSMKDYNFLDMAIRGLLFIKPLKVEFNFNGMSKIDDDLFLSLVRLSKEITKVEGIVSFKANSEDILSKIKKLEI